MAKVTQKIIPFLWFYKGAEDAADYYVSVFKNSKIKSTQKYPKEAEAVAGMPAGSVMTVELQCQKWNSVVGAPTNSVLPGR